MFPWLTEHISTAQTMEGFRGCYPRRLLSSEVLWNEWEVQLINLIAEDVLATTSTKALMLFPIGLRRMKNIDQKTVERSWVLLLRLGDTSSVRIRGDLGIH